MDCILWNRIHGIYMASLWVETCVMPQFRAEDSSSSANKKRFRASSQRRIRALDTAAMHYLDRAQYTESTRPLPFHAGRLTLSSLKSVAEQTILVSKPHAAYVLSAA